MKSTQPDPTVYAIRTDERPAGAHVCKQCGQEHSPNAWKLAVIITNGRNVTRTDYGEKTVCGLAAMIDNFKTDAPTTQPRKETEP